MKSLICTFKAFYISFLLILFLFFLDSFISNKGDFNLDNLLDQSNFIISISSKFIFLGSKYFFTFILLLTYLLGRRKHFKFGIWLLVCASLLCYAIRINYHLVNSFTEIFGDNYAQNHLNNSKITITNKIFYLENTVIMLTLAFHLTYLSADKRYGACYVLLAILIGYFNYHSSNNFKLEFLFTSLLSVVCCTLTFLIFTSVRKFKIKQLDVFSSVETI